MTEPLAREPSDDEVERVAKAMYYVANTHGWEDESDSCRWEYLQLAITAIAALRTP